ncbi:MAG: dihydroorotate dehydrogenase-like protein [Myxococcales bacterium]|nr:dihydroorotate dehydrogenase-like protein [Myxococcales bacterium]MCB9578453.1 dihydroorotate dehydrogenase-like protein [Polyangiaceae bacterium]
MDLSTTYLGLRLRGPLILGASPLVDHVDAVQRAVEAGASAVVMKSLFEEQLTVEQLAAHATETRGGGFAEAQSYLPDPDEFSLGPEEYLDQIRKIKSSVDVPVIGSLNGVSPRGWLRYAKLIEQAGVDALELNVYQLGADPEESAEAIEQRILEMVTEVKKSTKVPVAIKLSPFHTSLAHFAKRLDAAGVDGFVLFNRFYQPDIDVEELEIANRLALSTPSELLLRLRWLAILSGKVKGSLALSGGAHGGLDVVKALMAGAHVVQVVSAVLHNGPDHFRRMHEELSQFFEEHEYASLDEMRGNMSLERCPDPRTYERANYIHILQSWQLPPGMIRR